MYGGARLGTYDTQSFRTRYIVNHNYDDDGGLIIDNEAVPGATYDRATNTLTIDNVHQKANQLFVWYMGDDFKLNVVGENEFGIIFVYNYFNFHSTSPNIIGSGTLTVNQELINNNALHMYSDGSSTMHLDIADSVTVNLYAKEKENGEASVVTLNSTSITPADGGAITVGGKAAPEAQNEQIVYEDSDYVPVVKVEDRDREVARGTQVKSKSDPDGIYALGAMEGSYLVTRYIYVDEIGAWTYDPSFAQAPYIGHRYKKSEFEAEYDYVYGQAPTPIGYMADYRIDWRGDEGIKMTKDGEPDAVYVGQPSGGLWDWDESYSGNYEIHRVIWDDSQEIYVEDTGFKAIDLMAAELAENGYHIIEETHDEHLTLTVWTSDDPEDSSRFDINADSMIRKSDPDGLYVKLGTYGYESGDANENGILVYKVHYNPETDEHYVMYHSYEEPECMWVSYADLQSGASDFSYETEAVTEPVELHFLPEDYNINWDLTNAVQLKKTDEPGAVYAYRHWTHYMEDDTERDEYGIVKLNYNEGFGCYVEDADFNEFVIYDLKDLGSKGYEIVMSEQPLDFVTKGSVYLSEYPAYTDNDGGTYYADYDNHVYSYTDEDLITIGGEDYYYGTLMHDLSTDDLNDTVHDTLSDNYNYWIPGTEYHHVAGEQPEYVEYDLWVNGERLNSDRLRIPCGDGVAIYDPAKKTLTLDNAEITKGVEEDMLGTGVLSYIDHLTVVVKGDCTITETGGDGIGSYNFGSYQIGDVIYPTPYDITITGDGTLTIKESTPLYGYGLYCTGNLVLDGVKINITSASTGVWASDLEIRDTEADIHCTSRFSGIVVNRGDFDFENSTVTAVSDQGAGLLLGSDKVPSALTVSSGTLSLKGNLGVQGVVDNSIIAVNGGTLSVVGSEKALDESFLADNAKNVVMGEGIGVISGSLDGKRVVISAAPSVSTVSGTITSYLDAAGEVTVKLMQGDETVARTSTIGLKASYSFKDVTDGDYILRISKPNHVTRDYEITVSGDTTQDVQICPIGDVNMNGRVQANDAMLTYKHAQGKAADQLTGYQFLLADVNNNNKVQANDAMAIYRQATGKHNLF